MLCPMMFPVVFDRNCGYAKDNFWYSFEVAHWDYSLLLLSFQSVSAQPCPIALGDINDAKIIVSGLSQFARCAE